MAWLITLALVAAVPLSIGVVFAWVALRPAREAYDATRLFSIDTKPQG